MGKTILQSEVLNQLDQRQHTNLIRFFLLPVKSQSIKHFGLLNTQGIRVLRMQLLVKPIMLFHKLIILTDLPLFFPFVIIVKNRSNVFLFTRLIYG